MKRFIGNFVFILIIYEIDLVLSNQFFDIKQQALFLLLAFIVAFLVSIYQRITDEKKKEFYLNMFLTIVLSVLIGILVYMASNIFPEFRNGILRDIWTLFVIVTCIFVYVMTFKWIEYVGKYRGKNDEKAN